MTAVIQFAKFSWLSLNSLILTLILNSLATLGWTATAQQNQNLRYISGSQINYFSGSKRFNFNT